LTSGVLITRPEPGAAETAGRVAALGWQPVLAPALVLAPRDFAPPPRAQALLLTSRAAARNVPVIDLPVFAVGEATAAEARSRGFAQVAAAEGDAAALATLVAATLNRAHGPLLLAMGEGYGQELASALRGQGFTVIRRIAYAARPAEALPEPARLALAQGAVAAALFFSPRSAQSALALLAGAGLAATAPTIRALALSPRVAGALAPLPWREVRVAAYPDQDSLLAILGSAVKA
jgi:uroporphyrinogen-III synthase